MAEFDPDPDETTLEHVQRDLMALAQAIELATLAGQIPLDVGSVLASHTVHILQFSEALAAADMTPEDIVGR